MKASGVQRRLTSCRIGTHPFVPDISLPTLIGKTVADEVSVGILGENAFDGTPVIDLKPILARRQER